MRCDGGARARAFRDRPAGGPRSKLLVSLVYDSVVAFQWPQAAALAFVLLALALATCGLILAVLRPGRVQGGAR